MKRLLLLNIIVVLSLFLNAQPLKSKDTIQSYKSSFNMQMGGFTGTSNYGSYFGSYVAPQIQFNNNSKFSFGGGAIISTTNMQNVPLFNSTEQTFKSTNYNLTQSTFYINGSYKASENLTIHALAYKGMSLNNPDPNQMYIDAFNQNSKGFLMNIDYKIGQHSSINLGFNYSSGYNATFSPMNFGRVGGMGMQNNGMGYSGFSW